MLFVDRKHTKLLHLNSKNTHEQHPAFSFCANNAALATSLMVLEEHIHVMDGRFKLHFLLGYIVTNLSFCQMLSKQVFETNVLKEAERVESWRNHNG